MTFTDKFGVQTNVVSPNLGANIRAWLWECVTLPERIIKVYVCAKDSIVLNGLAFQVANIGTWLYVPTSLTSANCDSVNSYNIPSAGELPGRIRGIMWWQHTILSWSLQ
jgi:hypothetical protein